MAEHRAIKTGRAVTRAEVIAGNVITIVAVIVAGLFLVLTL